MGTGLVGAPACGDVMKLQIRVDPSNQTISDVKFKTFGCGSAIASSSYLTELVRGMTLEDAGKIRNTQIAQELCLPPVKCELTSKADNIRVMILTMFSSALFDVGRRCYQVRDFELLHQKSNSQACHESGRDWSYIAKGECRDSNGSSTSSHGIRENDGTVLGRV